jgi:hypothetical protein
VVTVTDIPYAAKTGGLYGVLVGAVASIVCPRPQVRGRGSRAGIYSRKQAVTAN